MPAKTRDVATAVTAGVGVILLVFESIQALRSVVIGTLGTVLLFAGVAFIAVAALLVVLAAWQEPAISVTAEPSAPTDAPTVTDYKPGVAVLPAETPAEASAATITEPPAAVPAVPGPGPGITESSVPAAEPSWTELEQA
jgi:hypothetical protein